MTDILRQEGKKHTGTMPRDDRGRDWIDAAIIQGMPRIYGHHQKLGKGKEGVSEGAYLISDF